MAVCDSMSTVDHCRLNAATLRASYPISRMDEWIDFFGEIQIFSTLDANSGYWKIEINDMDVDETEVLTHHGIYRY